MVGLISKTIGKNNVKKLTRRIITIKLSSLYRKICIEIIMNYNGFLIMQLQANIFNERLCMHIYKSKSYFL